MAWAYQTGVDGMATHWLYRGEDKPLCTLRRIGERREAWEARILKYPDATHVEVKILRAMPLTAAQKLCEREVRRMGWLRSGARTTI